MERLRIIVSGYIGLLTAGGVAWDYVQYPLGLAELGHDVYYVEDTQVWPVYQVNHVGAVDCVANVAHLARVMEDFGLRDRWAYRDELSGQWFGLSEASVRELCRTADIFINVSCATPLRDQYAAIPVRAVVDSDPMFTQIQYISEQVFTEGRSGMRLLLEGHTHHFTFGENIGVADCRVPLCGFEWRSTRQPVCLSCWPVAAEPVAEDAAFSTLMNWTAGRPLLFEGEKWGQKDVEFRRYAAIPRRIPGIRLAVAVGQTVGEPFPAELAREYGWEVLDPAACAPDWRAYRDYIQGSRGEFSVAKETYVKARTGWFSCRSACYLASGRPVVTQDTGWSRYLPTGCGLFAFEDEASAAEAIASIAADPGKHSRAARAIAEAYFDSRHVLGEVLTQLGA